MSQKELNYVEDIYNHECLIMNIIDSTLNDIDDDTYSKLLESALSKHSMMNKQIIKLLEANN